MIVVNQAHIKLFTFKFIALVCCPAAYGLRDFCNALGLRIKYVVLCRYVFA